MKKLLLLIIAFSFFTLTLSAQEASENAFEWELIGDGTYPENDAEEVAVAEEEPFEAEEEDTGPKKFRFKNRHVEVGLVNASVSVSNNFLSLDEIFSETVILDLEELDKGLRFDLTADIRPLYFFYTSKSERWGWGLDIGRVSVFGNMDISGNLIRFKKTDGDGDKFGAGAAAFVDVGAPFFFHLNKLNGFKINARPSLFAPVVYLTPNMNYKYTDSKKGAKIQLDYDMQLYSMMALGEGGDGLNYTLGFDFSAGTEYPLFSWLDLGVDITNIPLVPGSLSNYMKMKGKVKIDTSKLTFETKETGEEGEEASGSAVDDMIKTDIEETSYGEDKKYILRPFKMVFYANYRPFETVPSFTVIPRLGFAINPLYAQPGSLEIGASANINLANLFIPTIGINYTDRQWKNSLDIILNLHAFELDLGVALQSPSFAKSWTGAGLGLNVGLKFGW